MISQPSLDPSSLSFDLPDPEQDDLSNVDFIERLENAWSICEQFDLQGDMLKLLRIDIAKGGGDSYSRLCMWYDYEKISFNLIKKFHTYALELGQKYQMDIDNIQAEDTSLPDLVFKGKDFYIDYI